MASSEPSRSWLSGVKSKVSEKVGELYHATGLGKQDEADKYQDETSAPTGEMSTRKTRSAAKKESEPPALLESQHPSMGPQLKDSMVDSELMDTQVKTLLTANGELNTKLQERDRQIIALQQEASVIARKNQDLEARLSKSKHKDLLEQIKEKEQKLQESDAYLRKQSVLIATLRDEQLSKESEDIAKYHKLEDELAKVTEDFESARYSLEQEKADKKILLAKLSGFQSHSDMDECFNPLCVEKRAVLERLLEDKEAFSLKVSSLEKALSHTKEANAELVKERDEARNECAIAKAEAEIFKVDFEEERRDRAKAQGALDAYTNKKNYTAIFEEQTADLRKEVERQREVINQHKIDLAKMTSDMKSKSETSKQFIRGLKLKVEEQSQEIDYYKKRASKVSRLQSEVDEHKTVTKEMISKLNQKSSELNQLQKDCMKLKSQVSHGEATNHALTHALERVKQNLANVKSELQELKKSNRKLKNSAKNPVKVRKSSSQHPAASADGGSDDSSIQKLYDEELARNLELRDENEYMKGKIEDLSMEVEEHKKLMHEITKYRFEVDQGAQTSSKETHSSDQHSKPSSHHMETRSTKSTTGIASQHRHTYEHIHGDKGQDIITSNAVFTTPLAQDKPPLPPRDYENKTKMKANFEDRQKKKCDMVHEALHEGQSSQDMVTERENTQGTEAAGINSKSTIPVGKDRNPLRAGGKANLNNRDIAASIPKGKDGRPLRAGGTNGKHREYETKQKDHRSLGEVPDIPPRKVELHRSSSMDNESRHNLNSQVCRSSKDDSSFNVASKTTSRDGSYSPFNKAQSGSTNYQVHPAIPDQPKQNINPGPQPGRIDGNHPHPSNVSNRQRECLEGGGDSSPNMSSEINTGSRSQDFNPDPVSHIHSDYGDHGVHDIPRGGHRNYSYPNHQIGDSADDYYGDIREQQQNRYSGTDAARMHEGGMGTPADFDKGRRQQRWQHSGSDAAGVQKAEITNSADVCSGGGHQQSWQCDADSAQRRETEIPNPVGYHRARDQQQYPYGAAAAANQDEYRFQRDQEQSRYRGSKDLLLQGNSQRRGIQGHNCGKSDEISDQLSTGELASSDGSHITYPSLDAQSNYGNDGHGLSTDSRESCHASSEHLLQEQVMSLQPVGANSGDFKRHSAGRPILPTEQARISSERYHDSNPVEDIPVVAVDPNSLTQPMPKRHPSSIDSAPSTVQKNETEDDDEDLHEGIDHDMEVDLHEGIDHDMEVIAEEVSNEVNRDPSLDVTVNEKPYDPNLVCPICGKKFRIGEIQKFRKHVDACI